MPEGTSTINPPVGIKNSRGRTLLTQDAILPGIIKQRHLGEGNRFIRSGLAANRPTSGEPVTANSSAYYFATDTNVLSVWNGTAWKSVTLT